MSSCGVSSLALNSLRNLTSLLYLDMNDNQLTKTIPKSLCNLCNLKRIDLGVNDFRNVSLTSLLEGFFECKVPNLEWLSLEWSGLSGRLPAQIGQLEHLVQLQLGANRIVGTIPDSIGRLSFLRYLDLDDNRISGMIPYSIGGLSSLVLLDLSRNQLSGNLPGSLGQLSKVDTLDLSSNSLKGVVTEAHFANLTRLKYLMGTGNRLTLRPRLANWNPSFRLQMLNLKSWDLGPEFPLWILLQRELTLLDISNTRISSAMPKAFWRSLPDLEYLDMSQNQIQGRLFEIPTTISAIDLSSNELSGELPEVTNGSNGMISNNSFVGSLQQLLCPNSDTSLEALNLATNHLSGFIPECWMKWPNLTFLDLQNNDLSGRIPTTLGSLSSLASLDMSNNKLSGRLPVSLRNLTNLQILQLARNELVGGIPAWLGREISSLRILNLRSNNFVGHINDDLCYLTVVQILDLSHNNLSGNIPGCFNNFSVMSKKITTRNDQFVFMEFDDIDILGSVSLVTKGKEYTYNTILGLVMVLDLSSNDLSGSIPSELTSLHALQSLNLSRNQLTGRIPEKIGDLSLLESFDVLLNRLSGGLPASLSSLSFLSSFNVLFNELTGRIPSSTQLQSLNQSSFFGNKLCGVPLIRHCGEVVPNKDREEGKGSDGVDGDLIISIVSGFVAGFWVVVVMFIFSKNIAHFHFLNKLKCTFNLT